MSELLLNYFWVVLLGIAALAFVIFLIVAKAIGTAAEWWEAKLVILRGRSISWDEACSSAKSGHGIVAVSSWRFLKKVWFVEKNAWASQLPRPELLRRHGQIVIGIPQEMSSLKSIEDAVGTENFVDLCSHVSLD